MAKWYKRKTISGKRINIHKLIMEEHLGRSMLPSEIVHHKDDNPRNNIITNLELMSKAKHLKLHLTGHKIGNNKGSKHGKAKLIEGDVLEIRQRLQDGELINKLALEYNVSWNAIYSIKCRITWKHI